MSETLYIQINRNIQVDKREITIGDVAALLCKNAGITARVKTIKLITLPDVPKRRVSFSVMTVMEKIEKKIRDEYQPNQKLPSERELVKMYGISRSTVRLALNDLEERGIIFSSFSSCNFFLIMLICF